MLLCKTDSSPPPSCCPVCVLPSQSQGALLLSHLHCYVAVNELGWSPKIMVCLCLHLQSVYSKAIMYLHLHYDSHVRLRTPLKPNNDLFVLGQLVKCKGTEVESNNSLVQK